MIRNGAFRSLKMGIQVFRSDGLLATLRRGVYAIGWYRCMLIYGGAREQWPFQPTSLDLRFEALGESNIHEYLMMREDQTEESVRCRQQRGDRCLMVRSEKRLIGMCWLSIGSVWVDYLHCEVKLAPGVGFFSDSYVLPEFRGQRVSESLAPKSFDWFEMQGCDRVIGMIWTANAVSLYRAKRQGYNGIGLISRWKFGPWARFVLNLDEDFEGVAQI